jgi:hypothetical protein
VIAIEEGDAEMDQQEDEEEGYQENKIMMSFFSTQRFNCGNRRPDQTLFFYQIIC